MTYREKAEKKLMAKLRENEKNSYFVLPYSTTRHHKYWIYQTIGQSNSIKFFITLFTDHNTFWVKHATHRKA